MQSVNPPSNKACQTSVYNRHLRGNYPPFAALHTITSSMFWSEPSPCTALASLPTSCIAPVETTSLNNGKWAPTGPCLDAGLLLWPCGLKTSQGIPPACLSGEVISPKAARSHQTFCSDGRGLHLCWAVRWPPAPCGYRMLDMWIVRGTRFHILFEVRSV